MSLDTSNKTDLPQLAVTRPLLIMVLNILVIIAGLAALFGLDVRELPDVDRPIVSINATYPGAAPETVDSEVTRVLEDAAARVPGVRDVNSSSEENSARIRVEFAPGSDLDTAAADVREAVNRVTRDLPERVEQVQVAKADSDARPIINLAASSTRYDLEDFTRILENDVAPEFLSISGVASVDLFGARQRQMRVVVDPLRLTRFGLTISDVAAALRQAPFDVPVGSFRSVDQELVVRAEATAATPELIKDVIISGDTRVGDVAEAYFAPADATNFVRLDGQPIIGLGIVRQAQSNTIEISTAVKTKVKQLNARFADIDITVTSDDADFIRQSVSEVLVSLGFTVLIVVATIYLFFGSFGATLMPSTTIPIALVGTLAGIWLFGFSINLLTLLALVLATGLIVDDAIVVLENIQRLQREGMRRKAAAVLGTRQVFFAVVATTAVLVAVFLPISFLPSTAGRLFREFGFVLALSVIISSFVALSIVPALAARMPLTSAVQGKPPSFINRLGGRLAAVYGAALRAVLRRPWASFSLAVLAAAGAFFAFGSIKQELVPGEDRGTIFVFAGGPDGVGIDYMDRQADAVEAILEPLRESGEITSIQTIVGRWDPNRVWITATLAPWDERTRSQSEIISGLRGQLGGIPGARASAFGGNSLNLRGGNTGGIEVALTGGDYASIYQGARALAQAIDAGSTILANPEISYKPTQPQLSIRIDRRRAADLGVSLDDLALTLRAMVGGENLIDLNVSDQAIPVILEAPSGAITSPTDLRNLFVRTSGDALVPLSSMTEIVEEGIAAELDRTEQRRAIEFEANIAPGVALADAVAELERLAAQSLPDGIDILLKGEAATLEETSQDVLLTYGFAFVIVLLVLIAQFESITSAAVVMVTVPFGLAAAIYALAISGISLNIYSQIGLVMLIGLMAKNGILVVEFADQLRSSGRSLMEATEEAARIRLRPITMTLLSTVIGALPLILGSGAGAEARASIGWVVFGGLGLAGFITLFLTPVVYFGLARFSRPRSDDANDLEAQLRAVRTSSPADTPAE